MSLSGSSAVPRKLAIFVLVVGFLPACGGGGSKSSAAKEASSTTAAAVPTTEVIDAPAPGPGQSPRITVKNLIYRPSPDSVAPGTTVTWLNADSFTHTVTSGVRGKPDGKFDTELTQKGSSFSFTFPKAGTFPYFCSIHSGTEGVITVK